MDPTKDIKQRSSGLEPESLHPLHELIIANQATQNVGTLGHVSHGKSTLVEAISGIKTVKFGIELRRNITIKLGYANFKVFQCPRCPKPQCFHSGKSSAKPPKCPNKGCGAQTTLIRHFSFVDCPGHELLMSTMLNGAAVMDSALLVVAANQAVPQPQTAEHLAAAEIMGLKNIVCVQTKVDLVKEEEAVQNHQHIKEFVQGTAAQRSPVLPVSSRPDFHANLDVLLQYLVEAVPVPRRDFTSPPLLTVVRSFDVNYPGSGAGTLKGGVAGGTLKRGVLRIGQEIEVRPGLISREANGTVRCTPLRSVVKSLFSEQNSMQLAVPGGLIAVGTSLDPSLTMKDRLVGQVVGVPGQMPEVYAELEIRVQLMSRVVGQRSDDNAKPERVKKLAKDELLMVNVASDCTQGKVLSLKGSNAVLLLAKPCCVEIGEEVSLSRKIQRTHRLIGRGTVVRGKALPLEGT